VDPIDDAEALDSEQLDNVTGGMGNSETVHSEFSLENSES
jgi:hypothetical protein